MNRKYKQRKKRKNNRGLMISFKVVLASAAIGVVVICGSEMIHSKSFIKGDVHTINDTNLQYDNEEAKNNTVDDNNTGTQKENVLDNSGYLTLENDPNAEDVMDVFHRTEGLLKGTLKYPVRTDGKKVVYLTFDDGPSTENTANVLDTLDRYGIKATFFVTGTSIEKNDEAKALLKRIAADGNAIGNHTYSHDYNKLYPGRTIDPVAFMEDVEKNNEVMKSVLGKDFSTRAIRFPGGYWTWNGRTGIRPIIDENGYAIIDWNALSEDAEGKPKSAEELVEKTKTNVEALGPDADSIVFLMHDTYGKKETAKALPQIIEYFKSKGFEFKTMK